MVTRMGIRELRDGLTAAVRRVRNGETIEVTHDGDPVAILAPLPRDRLARLAARGDVTLPERPLRLPDPLPVTGEMTASEALAEDRDSER